MCADCTHEVQFHHNQAKHQAWQHIIGNRSYINHSVDIHGDKSVQLVTIMVDTASNFISTVVRNPLMVLSICGNKCWMITRQLMIWLWANEWISTPRCSKVNIYFLVSRYILCTLQVSVMTQFGNVFLKLNKMSTGEYITSAWIACYQSDLPCWSISQNGIC